MLCILIALYKHACNAISLSGHKKTLSEVGVGISAIPLWGALHCIAWIWPRGWAVRGYRATWLGYVIGKLFRDRVLPLCVGNLSSLYFVDS